LLQRHYRQRCIVSDQKVTNMLTLIFITSLKCLFVYEGMKEGNVLSWLRLLFIRLLLLTPHWFEQYAKKPLYDCLFCFGSLWGILFTFQYFSFTWQYLTLLFAIAGMNYLVGTFIGFVHWWQEEDE
jgi:hypothetical protein